ncbi:3-dehydroquinate synthase [bacterium]|nr:3-dehydroquinate synthase [bacterium]
MKEVKVNLRTEKYSILIGNGILDQVTKWIQVQGITNVFILGDNKLIAAQEQLKIELSRIECQVESLLLPVSEELKSFTKVYPIYGELLNNCLDRHSCIIALGGGVIGDLGGFIASTYLRGIKWIGIPTTLLAQVDSSVGGKTGVNHESGKNLIGTFYQPSLVVSDISFLQTLDYRDRISGIGEMLKYSITYDPSFFEFLSKRWPDIINLESSVLEKAVSKCVQWKARVVWKDPFETKGFREILNFGHTLGHALETAVKYQGIRHGEAVIFGMRAASLLSVYQSHLSKKTYDKIESTLAQIPTPKVPDSIESQSFLEIIRKDKKNKNGKIRFILLKGIGKTVIDSEITSGKIIQVIDQLRK